MALDLGVCVCGGGGTFGWELGGVGPRKCEYLGGSSRGEAPGGPEPKNKEPPAAVGAVKCEAAGLSVS